MVGTFKVDIEAVVPAFGHSMIYLVGRVLALDGAQREIHIRFINSQVDFDPGSLMSSRKITVQSYPMLGRLGFLRFDQRLGTIVFEHPFMAWNLRVTLGRGRVSAVRIKNDLEITVSLESNYIEFKGSVAGMVTDEKGREAYPFDVSSICLPMRFSECVEELSIRVKVPTISTFIACMFEKEDATAIPVALGEDYIWPRGVTDRQHWKDPSS